MESEMIMESGGAGGGDGDDDDDWLVSSIVKRVEENLNLEDEFDILDEDGEVIEKSVVTVEEEDTASNNQKDNNGGTGGGGAGNDDDDDDDEYADMDAFEDDNILQDDDAVATSAAVPTSTTTNDNNDGDDDQDHTVKVRTYDLSITYDKYYQTPRVWMIGRNEYDQPLTGQQMMEDVISDYANKTVTMESHPHVAGPHASVHPCQHGKVMKAIVKNLIKKTTTAAGGGEEIQDNGGDGPSVEMYLFIFLKFVSSMIPTINYDFTMDVTADTSK